ncbi:DUF427 domain-containing protein [Streptomyces xiangluensis]|uniref:DUF427 domain-containing protein n=1 Tax=Streptomyces xiangluensis TaxID=2665720 RepID=A0ABV8YXB9_9ACTN
MNDAATTATAMISGRPSVCGRRPNRVTTPTTSRADDAPASVPEVVENSSLIRVVTRDGRKVVARTTSAVTLTEAGCPAVQCILLADVDQALLERTDSHTYCPYKGEASYYSLVTPEKKIADTVWF